MSHPLFRLLPPPLRAPAYYRLYRARAAARPELFEAAPLADAPGVRLRLRPGDVAHGEIAVTGRCEPRLTRRLLRLARNAGGVLADVGANAGYFSLLWCAARGGNRAVAYEPAPAPLELLRANVATNGLPVAVRPVACGERAGELRFDPGDAAGQTTWGGFDPAGALAVSVVALDDEFPAPAALACLKIDAEGADALALRGARRLLAGRRVGCVFFEANLPRERALGVPAGESARLLAECGYRVRPLDNPSESVCGYQAEPV